MPEGREEAVEAMAGAMGVNDPTLDAGLREVWLTKTAAALDALTPFVVFRSELEQVGWLIGYDLYLPSEVITGEPCGQPPDVPVYRIREARP